MATNKRVADLIQENADKSLDYWISATSQEQLGLQSGFDRTYVSLLERGLRSPTLRVLFRLSDVLATASSTLIQRTERLLAQADTK